MELIKLQNIQKNYTGKNMPEVKVLRDVSIIINKGDFLAVKGPSGAGKSTLLHILGCIDTPTRGDYFLDGENINKLNSFKLAAIRNKRMGFVLQSFGLILEETAVENIKLPLYFTKASRQHIADKAYDMLEMFGLEKMAEKKVMNLSGGEKQRVAIARALINDPDIILADEPTGALDSGNSGILMDSFDELNRRGKTIVVVTHDDYVANRCKKIIGIKDGVLAEGSC